MSITEQASFGFGEPRAARVPKFVGAMPLVLNFEANWRARTVLLRGLGAAFILSATGLWLVPGAEVEPGMTLIKIGISVAFLFAGLVLMTIHDPKNQPEACFDPVRQELRILKADSRGAPRTILRRRYDTLGGARLTENSVQLFEGDGTMLVEIPVGSAIARSQLRDQLSSAVHMMS